MAKSGAYLRVVAQRVGVFSGVIALLAGGIVFYRFMNRNAPPHLEIPDIQDPSRQAASVNRLQGSSYFRLASIDDEKLPLSEPNPAPSQIPLGWENLAVGTSIKLGNLIHAQAHSRVEMTTAGQWYMSLEGDGGLVVQDARRSASGDQHLLSVYVQKGTFRAKSAMDDYHGYFLDVSTASAKIHVFEGEIGMNVNADGHGRMWLAKGRAEAVWNDGRRKELGLRGLEDL